MPFDVADDVTLTDPCEIADASRANLAQEQSNDRQMADDGTLRETAIFPKILAERLEDLFMSCQRWRRRQSDRASLSQHGQQAPQRCPVALLDHQLAGSMTKVRIDHAFVEIGRLGTAVREPTQQLADQVQASPSTIGSAPIIDKTRRVELDKLPVRPTLKTPEQPLPPKYSSAFIVFISAVASGGTGRIMPNRSYAGHQKTWEHETARHSSVRGVNMPMPSAA